MLQMNQNIIDKFSSFKKDQSTNENPPDINALKDVTNIQKPNKQSQRLTKLIDFYHHELKDCSDELSFSQCKIKQNKMQSRIPIKMTPENVNAKNGRNIVIDPSSFDISEIECHSSIEFSKKTPVKKQNYI